MPPTERLYYHDSHLIEFEARVLEISERVSGWTAVALDRTAFYPTGGGQPSDTGTLNGVRVVECTEDETERVWHVVQGNTPEIGTTVRGRVDWARRLDHMQQHTGQHILSQAFVTLFNAPTHSFRVLRDYCEIDVDLKNPSNEVIERAVELANNVIWEDRSVTIRQVTPEEAAELPLRKDPARQGELRLIEIDGFDLTPCGGTHAYRTGEVGMIAARHWERAKGLVRIEWVAGMRALSDYRRANQTGRAVAALFSSGRDDTPPLVEKIVTENKELHRRVRALEEIAAKVEADKLLATAPTLVLSPSDGRTIDDETQDASIKDAGPIRDGAAVRIVAQVFDNRDAESLRRLALSLVSHSNTIALLGSRDSEAARLVFAKSTDAPGDMNALMREACVTLEGRGGGKPDLAQGGGKRIEKLDEVIATAAGKV